MLAWVVIHRRHLRQSPQSRLMRALPLPASPLNLQLLAFNLPTFKRFLNLSPFFSNSSALFCSLLHFFALSKNSTGLFSCDSALFAKNHPGWGWLLPLAMESAQQQRPLTGKASLLFQLSTVDCQPPESHNSLQVVSYG